jgi:alpha-N-arabinofuranosidase
VKIGCLAQIVNVIAPILTNKTGVLIQSIYWPFEWFSKHAAGKTSLTPMIASPPYKAGARGEVPALDAAAAYDEGTGTLTVFLTNRSETTLPVTVDLAGHRTSKVLGGDVLCGPDLKASNSFDRPNTIRPRAIGGSVVEGKLQVTVPRTAFACIRTQVERV